MLWCRYTFWSFTRHDVQVPVTYHAVPVGEASPLDTCAPQNLAMLYLPLASQNNGSPCRGSIAANLSMRPAPVRTHQHTHSGSVRMYLATAFAAADVGVKRGTTRLS